MVKQEDENSNSSSDASSSSSFSSSSKSRKHSGKNIIPAKISKNLSIGSNSNKQSHAIQATSSLSALASNSSQQLNYNNPSNSIFNNFTNSQAIQLQMKSVANQLPTTLSVINEQVYFQNSSSAAGNDVYKVQAGALSAANTSARNSENKNMNRIENNRDHDRIGMNSNCSNSSSSSTGSFNNTSHTGELIVVEETVRKREMRLLKNREAARECRRKKKEYIKCLENRVAELENQNKTLIDELKSLKELYCKNGDPIH